MSSLIEFQKAPEEQSSLAALQGSIQLKILVTLYRSRSPGLKILVVDDESSLKFLSRELKRRHFSVEVHNDGEAACADLQKSICDPLDS